MSGLIIVEYNDPGRCHMGGQSGARGYLLQALICVLDSLDRNSSWTSVTIEPNGESEKVDLLWIFDSTRKVVQVKHSRNRIGLADATKWADELEKSVVADEYELRLLGPCADSVPPSSGTIGRVSVPVAEVINLSSLRKTAAHNLDLYLTTADPPRVLRPIVREVIVEALSNRLGTLSTDGNVFSRHEFDTTLQLWVNEILQQAGCKTTSTHSDAQRFKILERCLAKSHGRRVARWQAAGMSREIGIVLSGDDTLGTLSDEKRPNNDAPLRLISGPVGAGKSLAAERFFELSVRSSLLSVTAPAPVFLAAPDIHDGLERAILDECEGIGDPHVVGAVFIVDSLDELPASKAQRLLTEARAIVNAWPNSRAILTSRPMRCWIGVEELVTLDELTVDQSHALVARAAEQSDHQIKCASWNWSAPLKETIRTPLFAILLGNSLRDGREYRRVSRAGLVAHLVDAVLLNTTSQSDDVQLAFRNLAAQVLDRGGAIRAAELQPARITASLLQSGFVVESNGFLSFPLPILTQWFAARALVEGDVSVDTLWDFPSRVDRWRSSISIAVGTGSEDLADRILTPIAKRDPGFLLTIIDEATTHWTLDEGITPPNALQAGKRIRYAMDTCRSAIGLLAALVTPYNPKNPSLFPIAVRTENEWLVAGWSTEETNDEVTTLPSGVGLLDPMKAGENDLPGKDEMLGFTLSRVPPYWFDVRGARPGRQSAWAWRWVAEHLQNKLKERLQQPSMVDLCASPLVTEAAWHTAIEITNSNRLQTESIPISTVGDMMPFSIDELIERSNGNQWTLIRVGWRDIDVTLLGRELSRLRDQGISELSPLLPTPDRSHDPQHHFEWQWYSESRLFERIGAVFEQALRAYVQIVKEWFLPLSGRLDRAVTLPALVSVEVDLKDNESGMMSDPIIRTRWEPMPKDHSTQVRLTSANVNFCSFDPAVVTNLHHLVLRHRPDFSESLGIIMTVSRTADLFSDYAVRKLVYGWLEDDLQRIDWLAS